MSKIVILTAIFRNHQARAVLQRPLTVDLFDLKLRDFAKLWLFNLIIVVVVVSFISGLLNNINNKEK